MKRYAKHLVKVSYLFPAIVYFLLALPATASSQAGFAGGKDAYNPIPQKTDYKKVNYVVVGVFEFADNAGEFMSSVAGKGYQPDYFFYPPKQYYYVYVSSRDEFETARKETLDLRAKSGFEETWVFNPAMIGYMNADKSEPADAGWEEETAVAENTGETVTEEETPALTPQDNLTTLSQKSADEMEEPENLVVEEEVEGLYKIFADVNRINDAVDIDTDVDLVDNVRAKPIGTLTAHEVKVVKDPNNGSNTLQLVAQPLGYRKMIHTINLDSPVSKENSDFVQLDGGVIYVDFPLERLKKDDKVIMYKVFFQNDAAVLRPESKYELNALLEMMKENENYEIRLHGHTNGNSAGKIIRLADDSRDYFTLNDTAVEGWGSARQLSTERAETIKRYLVDNGIEDKRIDVKGWGGKQMLYDKNSASAKKNIRVEVEVLKD
ncbi:MAG: OmpA family protein [Cyclobacteriaceae bacterium]